MTKLSLLVVLLIVGVGFISCTRNHDSDLEQYLNDHEDEDDTSDDETEDDNETENDDNQTETQIEAPPSLRTAMIANNNAMKDFDTLMNNEAMRTSLQNISDKLKQFFFEMGTREAFKNIMKNVNMMQTIPEVNELTEKTIETWSRIIEDKDSKGIISLMKDLHQVVSEDQKLGETISIIKNAVHTVHNNNASMRILRGGIKTVHKLREQKAVHGILVDTLRILRDHEKTTFALTTVMKIAPFFGTLQNLMASTVPAQQDPEALTQQKSHSARPASPPRKISIRMRVDNNNN